jgi:hypothetical protein
MPVAPAGAGQVQTTCRFERLVNNVLSAGILLGATSGGVSARVTIDEEAGRFVLHGGSIEVPPYHMGFGVDGSLDTMDFTDVDFEGHIDSAGTIVIPGVEIIICTLDPHAGVCVPRNVCADDLSTACLRGSTDTGCAPGVACQGRCAGKHQTCASDADCGTGDRCGMGTFVPFLVTLSTDVLGFQGLLKRGEPLDFDTGQLMFTSLGPTPKHAPIVQDTHIAAIELTCTLDDVPAIGALPLAPATSAPRAQLKFGKGEAGSGDDSLKLKATYSPTGGVVPDLTATDVTLGLAATIRVCDANTVPASRGKPCTDNSECPVDETSLAPPTCLPPQETSILQLEIPAGTLTGNAKKTKFKAKDVGGACSAESDIPGLECTTDFQCAGGECVRIKPVRPEPGPDDRLVHKVAIKVNKDGSLKLSLNSSGMNLDDLSLESLDDGSGNVANITTRIDLGLQGAAVTSTPKGKNKGVVF